MRSLVVILAVVFVVGSVPTVEPDVTEALTDAAPPKITLKWSARHEESVYGYLIYRSDRRQGPFLRINSEIIHVEEPAIDEAVSSYEYSDFGVDPGWTYFYYLDTISNQGRKNRFSGVIKMTAPEAPDATSDGG